MNRLVGAAALIALTALGCSDPSPINLPVQTVVSLGREVVWTTDEPTLGIVRYGFTQGKYDRVAYPSAVDREDKSFSTEHKVTLFSLEPGRTVYLQLMDVTTDQRQTISREDSVRTETPAPDGPILEWTMIDVGWGDAHLLTMPNTGKRILIDAGERRDWENVRRYFEAEEITALDVVIGTHVHIDHMGGLVGSSSLSDDGVLGALDVDLFLDSPNKSATRSVHREALAAARDQGSEIDTVYAGDSNLTRDILVWDPEVQVQVWNSGDGRANAGDSDDEGALLNNDSIVLRVSFRNVDIVMGGDAEAATEGAVLDRQDETGGELESELLKIHHHGRDDASSKGFLDRVNARVGLIPTVRLELPYQGETLRRMSDRFMSIYASDLAIPLGIDLTGDDGHHVRMVTDGVGYEIIAIPSDSFHAPNKPSLEDAGAIEP